MKHLISYKCLLRSGGGPLIRPGPFFRASELSLSAVNVTVTRGAMPAPHAYPALMTAGVGD